MSNNNYLKGKWGEECAEQYLLEQGYQIIASNYHNKWGELDIVASLKEIIIFVEVKTRFNFDYGTPKEAVTYRKQCQLKKLAHIFIHRYKLYDKNIRFDVITVCRAKSRGSAPVIDHIRGAF